MIEDLGLARLGLWNQGLIQDIEDILADLLEFGFDLLTVVADSRNVLVGTLGLLLLFDRRDYAPGSTSGADNVLISDGQKVSLINGKFSAQLQRVLSVVKLLHQPSTLGAFSASHTFATSFMYVTISS